MYVSICKQPPITCNCIDIMASAIYLHPLSSDWQSLASVCSATLAAGSLSVHNEQTGYSYAERHCCLAGSSGTSQLL